MDRRQALLRQADEAEALAKLVSYGRDRTRLTERALELRAEADRLTERSDAPITTRFGGLSKGR